jgi:hypothetical protein
MTVSGELSCPPPGSYVSVSGQDPWPLSLGEAVEREDHDSNDVEGLEEHKRVQLHAGYGGASGAR